MMTAVNRFEDWEKARKESKLIFLALIMQKLEMEIERRKKKNIMKNKTTSNRI